MKKVYWMRHPDHGVKCAETEMEAKADMANGWQPCPPNGVEEKTPPKRRKTTNALMDTGNGDRA